MRAFLPICLLIASVLGAPLDAPAQTATARAFVASPEAVAACERAARQALVAQLPSAAEPAFNGPTTVQQSLSSDSQLVLRGSARWKGTTGVQDFNYSCNVDPRTARVAGVVMRDAAVDAAAVVTARAPAEPDLSHLSPAACETSAAEALKKQWPGVSQISFDSATRRFLQSSAAKAELHGHGRALPAPGSPSTHFGFECAIDPRDGRLLGTRVSG